MPHVLYPVSDEECWHYIWRLLEFVHWSVAAVPWISSCRSQVPVKRQAVLAAASGRPSADSQDSAPAPPPDNFILDCYCSAPRHCWWNLNMRNIRKDSRMLRRKTKFPSFCLPSEQFADLPYFPFYSGTRQLFPPPPLPALTCNLNRYDELIC